MWKELSAIIWQWDLEANKILEGEFSGWAPFTEGDFGTCNKYFMEADVWGRVSFVGGSAFDKLFEGAEITVGDKIRIEFMGKKDLGDGKRVNIFKLSKWIEGPEEPDQKPQAKKAKK